MLCLGVSTDDSSHGSLNLFAVVIHNFHKVYGIKWQLIILNITLHEKLETLATFFKQTLKTMAFSQSMLHSLLTTTKLIWEKSIALEIKMSSTL
jgi:hypothetical protein